MAQLSMEPVAWEFVWTKSLDHCIQQGLAQPGSAAWERTRLDTELELNTASVSNTNGGEIEEMGYSTEMKYSRSDQDYDYFHILHGKLRIYFNQTWCDCWNTNYDCSGEFHWNYLNLNEVYFIKAIKNNSSCKATVHVKEIKCTDADQENKSETEKEKREIMRNAPIQWYPQASFAMLFWTWRKTNWK